MKFKELLMKRFVGIISLVLVLGILFIVIYNKEEKIDSSFIITKLENSSELITAKLKYTGMGEYTDDGIGFINRSDFKMVYEATASIGIDVDEIEVNVDNFSDIVWVKVPKAKILSVKVDPNSIKYFDEKFALFNFDSKDDANRANSLVENSAYEELNDTGIMDMANRQSEVLIKGLIQDIIPKDYEIKFK